METNNYTEFERLLKSKVADHSYPYDKSDWSDFEKKLDASPRNPFTPGKTIFYFIVAAMVGFITYFAADYFISQQSEKASTNNATKSVSAKNETNASDLTDNSNNSTSQKNNTTKTSGENTSGNNLNTENTNNSNESSNKNGISGKDAENSYNNSNTPNKNNTTTTKQKVNYSFDDLIFSDIVEGCAPLKVQFTPLVVSDTITYTWNFGDSKTSTKPSPSHVYSKSGSYAVTLTCKFKKSQKTKKITYSQSIEVKPSPQAQFSYSKDAETDIYKFTDESVNAVSWYWNFGDKNTSKEKSPEHSYRNNGNYNAQMIILNMYGCADTASKKIDVKLNDLYKIPSAFSPNYDGNNDYFGPEGINLTNDGYKMSIYGKQGNVIFETKELENKWDGKNKKTNQIEEPGVYIWKITIKDKYGIIQERTGSVTIVP